MREFHSQGRQASGAYSLVRLKRPKQWLLIKTHAKKNYCKTSGKTGIHVLVPLGGQCYGRSSGNVQTCVAPFAALKASCAMRPPASRGKCEYNCFPRSLLLLDATKYRHRETVPSKQPRPVDLVISTQEK